MDRLHNTAVSPDRVDRCNLLGYRIITTAVTHFTSSLFPIPLIVMLELLSSPPSSSITQLRGHIAASPSPSPHYNTGPNLYREKNSAFSSLVDSRRFVPTHAARRFQQLVDIFFSILYSSVNKYSQQRSQRWLFNSRTNASINSSSIRVPPH